MFLPCVKAPPPTDFPKLSTLKLQCFLASQSAIAEVEQEAVAEIVP